MAMPSSWIYFHHNSGPATERCPLAWCHQRPRADVRTLRAGVQVNKNVGDPHRRAPADLPMSGGWEKENRHVAIKTNFVFTKPSIATLIARFMGPIWGPPGADRTQVDPMLAPWTLLFGQGLVLQIEARYQDSFRGQREPWATECYSQ